MKRTKHTLGHRLLTPKTGWIVTDETFQTVLAFRIVFKFISEPKSIR